MRVKLAVRKTAGREVVLTVAVVEATGTPREVFVLRHPGPGAQPVFARVASPADVRELPTEPSGAGSFYRGDRVDMAFPDDLTAEAASARVRESVAGLCRALSSKDRPGRSEMFWVG